MEEEIFEQQEMQDPRFGDLQELEVETLTKWIVGMKRSARSVSEMKRVQGTIFQRIAEEIAAVGEELEVQEQKEPETA
jgi:hypothetical protein